MDVEMSNPSLPYEQKNNQALLSETESSTMNVTLSLPLFFSLSNTPPHPPHNQPHTRTLAHTHIVRQRIRKFLAITWLQVIDRNIQRHYHALCCKWVTTVSQSGYKRWVILREYRFASEQVISGPYHGQGLSDETLCSPGCLSLAWS